MATDTDRVELVDALAELNIPLDQGRINDTLAPKDSPAFTGTPTAPTVDEDDASTRIATTGFVSNAVEGVVGTIAPYVADAQAAAADATAAQVGAESARDQAGVYLSGTQAAALGMFPNTAAGIAGVADGAYFFVVGSGESVAALYRRSGATAVSQNVSIPSTALVTVLAAMTQADTRYNGAQWLSGSGAVLARAGLDGSFETAGLRLQRNSDGQSIGTNKGADFLRHYDLDNSTDFAGLRFFASERYAWALVTTHGAVVLAVRPDLTKTGFGGGTPTPTPTPGGPIDATPVFGNEVYLHPDYPTVLHVRQMTVARTDAQDITASIATNDGQVPSQSTDMLEVPSTLPASGAQLVFRASDAPTARNYIPLTVHRPRTGGRRAIIGHTIGDSITNDGMAYGLDATLTSMGWAPSWIGTINAAAIGGSVNSTGGPLTEARRVRAAADFAGFDTDGQMIPLPAGQEEMYLALSKVDKTLYNPYLRLADDNDRAQRAARIVTIASVEWIFDFKWYLDRFGFLDPPDFISGLLMRNDQRQAGSAAAARVARAWGEIMLPSILETVPDTTPILLSSAPSGRSLTSDVAVWPVDITIIRAIAKTVRDAGASNVHMCNLHAEMSSDVAFKYSGTLDPNTGVYVGQVDDDVHPGAYGGMAQGGVCLARAFDALLP